MDGLETLQQLEDLYLDGNLLTLPRVRTGTVGVRLGAGPRVCGTAGIQAVCRVGRRLKHMAEQAIE